MATMRIGKERSKVALAKRGAIDVRAYMVHPERRTCIGEDWGIATNISHDVLWMLAMMREDGCLGPYRLYLSPHAYRHTLMLSPIVGVPILQTIEWMPGFGPGSAKECAAVPAGQGVLAQMTYNRVDWPVGQDSVVMSRQSGPGIVHIFSI